MKTTDDRLSEISSMLIMIILLLCAILIGLAYGCTPLRSVPDTFESLSFQGGMFSENDTVINNDTLFYWK